MQFPRWTDAFFGNQPVAHVLLSEKSATAVRFGVWRKAYDSVLVHVWRRRSLDSTSFPLIAAAEWLRTSSLPCAQRLGKTEVTFFKRQ